MRQSMRCAVTMLATLLVTTLVAPQALAEERTCGQRGEALQQASLLISTMKIVPGYAEAYDFDCNDPDSLWLADEIVVQVEKESGFEPSDISVWPICEDATVVAAMVRFPDGEAASLYSLRTDCIAAVRAYQESPTSAFLTLTENGRIECVILDSSDAVRRISPNRIAESKFETIPAAELVETNYVPKAMSAIDSSQIARAPYQPQLGMVRVKQSASNLCWAACVSSIAKYMTGSALSDRTISTRVYPVSDNHPGTLEGVVSGFSYHTYSDGSTTMHAEAWDGRIYDEELRRWIDNGIPICAQLTPPAGSVGHVVVVGGYAYDLSGNMSIIVMDPWTGSYSNYAKAFPGYYASSSGYFWGNGSVVLTHWQKPYGGSKWSWVNLNGTLETGWMSKYGNWYWFDSSGYLVENRWCQIDGNWYYFNPGGSMLTGWYYDGAYWFYLIPDSGAAAIGWYEVDGEWYSFDSDGGMRRGWYKDGSTWYYLRLYQDVPSGGPSGSMLRNGTWTIDGKAYTFNSSGACLNP